MRLGFTPDDWQTLANALLYHAANYDVTETEATSFGTTYVVEGPLQAPDGRSPHVRVVWFIATGADSPQLVTAYPLKGMPDD